MKKSNLTAKQKALLHTIDTFRQQQGYFPSTRELADKLRIKSPNTIFSHLKGLIQKGYLQKNQKGSITNITDQPFQFLSNLGKALSIPFFPESIPAGFQAPAEDTGKDFLTIDQYVITNPSNTFALKVRGNSMEQAGIMPGDILLVERRTDAKSGQIVVAHLPDGFTVKRYVQEGGNVFLRAESSENYQIKLQEGTQLWGIVIGIIRKYN